MRLPTITGEFRLADDPELRFTQSGKAVTNLVLIASERRKNDQTGEWEDGDKTPFLRTSIWNQGENGTQAEDAAEAFVRGQKVLVTGNLFARAYQRNDGTEALSVELKYATVAAIPNGLPRGADAPAPNRRPQGQQQQADPWAVPNGQPQEQQADPPQWAR